MTRIGELGTTLGANIDRNTLWRNARHNIPEESILHSHHRGNPQIVHNYPLLYLSYSPMLLNIQNSLWNNSILSVLRSVPTWIREHFSDGNISHCCKIWGFHGDDYEEWCLLGCYAVWLL
jgi:hypothetical protein